MTKNKGFVKKAGENMFYFSVPSKTENIVAVSATSEDDAWEKLCEEGFFGVSTSEPEFDFEMAELLEEDYGWL